MYIQLNERRSFTAELPGRTITDLEIDSEWNGLTKLVHPASGLYLIVMRDVGMIVDGSESLINELLAPTVSPGYIHVPGRTITIGKYSIDVAPFSVAQYINCVDSNGKAYVSETETPRVKINYQKSKEACELDGGGLLRGSQHLALAMDIMSVPENWSGGKVGEGILYRGLHKETVSGAVAGTYESGQHDERRWHVLPTGDRIYDFAGHLYTWMHDDIHGNADGLTGKIPSDSPYLVIGSKFKQSQGMGWRPDGARDWSGGALVRGGCWDSGGRAGVFRLDRGSPGCEGGYVSFRCTKSLG